MAQIDLPDEYRALLIKGVTDEEITAMLARVNNNEHELNMILVEYLNLKYLPVVNLETGEVT